MQRKRGSVGSVLCVLNFVSKQESLTSCPSCFTAQESPSNYIRQEIKCIQEIMWMQQQTEKFSPPEIKPVTVTQHRVYTYCTWQVIQHHTLICTYSVQLKSYSVLHFRSRCRKQDVLKENAANFNKGCCRSGK